MISEYAYLSSGEKVEILENLSGEIKNGLIDGPFIHYLKEINRIRGVASMECCTGHEEKALLGYIDLRLSEEKYNDFKRVWILEMLKMRGIVLAVKEKYILDKHQFILPVIRIYFAPDRFSTFVVLLLEKLSRMSVEYDKVEKYFG